MSMILALLFLAATTACGSLIIQGLLPNSGPGIRPIQLGAGFFTGTTLIGLFATHSELSLHAIGYGLIALMSAVTAVVILKRHSRAATVCNIPASPANALSVKHAAAFLFIAALTATHWLLALANNLVRPIFPWDAFTTWMYRAKAWALSDSVAAMESTFNWLQMGGQSGFAIYANQYPAPLSAFSAASSAVVGGWNESAASLPWSIAALAIGSLTYGILRRCLTPLYSLTGAYLLLSMPLFETHAALAGYADLWILGTSGLGLVMLLLWREQSDTALLPLAFVLLCAGTQIKVEGWLWLFLGGLFVSISALGQRYGYRWLALGFFVMAGLMVGTNTYHIDLGVLGEWGITGQQLHTGALGSFKLRPFNVSSTYIRIVLNDTSFHLLAILTALGLANAIINRHAKVAHWLLILILITGIQLFIFAFSQHSLFAEQGTAVGRLLLQMSPVFILLGWIGLTSTNQVARSKSQKANLPMDAQAPSKILTNKNTAVSPRILVIVIISSALIITTGLIATQSALTPNTDTEVAVASQDSASQPTMPQITDKEPTSNTHRLATMGHLSAFFYPWKHHVPLEQASINRIRSTVSSPISEIGFLSLASALLICFSLALRFVLPANRQQLLTIAIFGFLSMWILSDMFWLKRSVENTLEALAYAERRPDFPDPNGHHLVPMAESIAALLQDDDKPIYVAPLDGRALFNASKLPYLLLPKRAVFLNPADTTLPNHWQGYVVVIGVDHQGLDYIANQMISNFGMQTIGIGPTYRVLDTARQ